MWTGNRLRPGAQVEEHADAYNGYLGLFRHHDPLRMDHYEQGGFAVQLDDRRNGGSAHAERTVDVVQKERDHRHKEKSSAVWKEMNRRRKTVGRMRKRIAAILFWEALSVFKYMICLVSD